MSLPRVCSLLAWFKNISEIGYGNKAQFGYLYCLPFTTYCTNTYMTYIHTYMTYSHIIVHVVCTLVLWYSGTLVPSSKTHAWCCCCCTHVWFASNSLSASGGKSGSTLGYFLQSHHVPPTKEHAVPFG